MTNTSATLRLTPRPPHPDDVRCKCRKLIFDGADRLLLARVTRFRIDGAWATCKVCKTEVKVPVAIIGADACTNTSSPSQSPPAS